MDLYVSPAVASAVWIGINQYNGSDWNGKIYTRLNKEAINLANKYLYDGKVIGIFPESTINKTKDIIMPFKYGAVSMAQKTDALIIPVGITGEYKFRSKNLVTRIGKPFKVTNLSLEDANTKLKEEITLLINKSLEENKN